MSKTFIVALAAALAAPALVAADCKMDGGEVTAHTISDQSLCVPQGEGDWTFSMSTSLLDVPAPDKGPVNWAGAVSSSGFMILDNTCAVRGSYAVGSCGVPAIIQENFLADVLTITDVFMDVGDPYFKFKYGDGDYEVRNNQCGCQDASHDLVAVQHCKCAFPVDGTGSTKKRAEIPAEERERFNEVMRKMAKRFQA